MILIDSRRRPVVFLALTVLLIGAGPDDEPKAPSPLRMTKPIICRNIRGYGDFDPIKDPKFTVDDKLSIYYETDGFTIEPTKTGFRALFIEDGRLRRKGTKDPVWTKEKMFTYEALNKVRPSQIYMKTDIGLKGLPPGDYELDLILHDGLAKDVTLTKSVSFKIIPSPDEPDAKPPVPPDPPEEKATDK